MSTARLGSYRAGTFCRKSKLQKPTSISTNSRCNASMHPRLDSFNSDPRCQFQPSSRAAGNVESNPKSFTMQEAAVMGVGVLCRRLNEDLKRRVHPNDQFRFNQTMSPPPQLPIHFAALRDSHGALQ
jgi:hypothetical protein